MTTTDRRPQPPRGAVTKIPTIVTGVVSLVTLVLAVAAIAAGQSSALALAMLVALLSIVGGSRLAAHYRDPVLHRFVVALAGIIVAIAAAALLLAVSGESHEVFPTGGFIAGVVAAALLTHGSHRAVKDRETTPDSQPRPDTHEESPAETGR